MDEAGLERAIAVKGSQAKLAAATGCTQQVISYYRRSGKPVSAELAVAIEAATGGEVPRWEMRPDLFPGPDGGRGGLVDVTPEDELRAHLYRLLARFLAAPPRREDLALAAAISGDDTALGKAVDTFAHVAARTDPEQAAQEYHDLFIGLGRGELLPYGSYYLTGFLNEKPLAVLRDDMARLGIARDPAVKEPEDHIAALMDMMAGLILGEFDASAALDEQKRFFDAHVASWAPHFFADLEAAKASVLYAALGAIGRHFMAIEETAFAMA